MQDFPTTGFVRLPQILAVIPVSKTAWYRGVREGRFPAKVKLSSRTTCWKASDISALIERLSANQGGSE